MIETDRKLLTEYLGECWHDCENDEECSKCKKTLRGYYFGTHRSFTTREDLYDLFGKIYEAGRWEEFEAYAWDRWPDVGSFKHGIGKYIAWLFCLSGSGYDAACQRVADWIKEANHEGPLYQNQGGRGCST